MVFDGFRCQKPGFSWFLGAKNHVFHGFGPGAPGSDPCSCSFRLGSTGPGGDQKLLLVFPEGIDAIALKRRRFRRRAKPGKRAQAGLASLKSYPKPRKHLAKHKKKIRNPRNHHSKPLEKPELWLIYTQKNTKNQSGLLVWGLGQGNVELIGPQNKTYFSFSWAHVVVVVFVVVVVVVMFISKIYITCDVFYSRCSVFVCLMFCDFQKRSHPFAGSLLALSIGFSGRLLT